MSGLAGGIPGPKVGFDRIESDRCCWNIWLLVLFNSLILPDSGVHSAIH